MFYNTKNLSMFIPNQPFAQNKYENQIRQTTLTNTLKDRKLE